MKKRVFIFLFKKERKQYMNCLHNRANTYKSEIAAKVATDNCRYDFQSIFQPDKYPF